MASETLSIAVTAELSQLRAELAKIPDITAQEARDMVTGIRKALKDAEGAAKSTNANIAADSKKTAAVVQSGWAAAAKGIQSSAVVSQLETVSAMLIQVGGSVSRVAATVTSAIRPVATLGATLQAAGGSALYVGGGLAAVAGGAAVVAFGAKALADGAADAADRLRDLGEQVDPSAQADIDAYRAATRDLSVAMDRLKVSVGAELAGDLAVIARAAAGLVVDFIKWRDAVQGTVDKVKAFTIELSNLTSFGLLGKVTDAVTDYAEASAQAAIAVDGLTSAQIFGLSAKQQEALRTQLARIEEQKRSAAEKAAATQHDLVMQARIAWWHADADAQAQAAADEIAASQAIRDQLLADNDAIQASDRERTQQQIDDVERVKAARLEEEARREAAFHQSLFEAAQISATILGNLATVTGATVDSYDARRQAGEEFTKAEARAANNALQEQKYISLAQAGISATLAGIGTYTALVAELVPPPAAAVAAGIVTASSYAAAATGINQGLPAFFAYPEPPGTSHNGGMVDTNGDGNADTPGNIAVKGGGNPAADAGSESSRSRGGSTISVDPRLNRLVVVDRGRVGKAPRRGGPR